MTMRSVGTRKMRGARRQQCATTPVAADDVKLSVPVAEIAKLRDGLRRASVAVLLFLVPAEGVLITMEHMSSVGSTAGRIGKAWGERLPWCLAAAATVLLLALFLSRFLPHGREAAAISPFWRRPYRKGEPGRGTLFLLVAAVILVGIGSKATFDAYNGARAMTGAGDSVILTIGENTHVTHISTSSRGITSYFLEGPLGDEVIAEGATGSAGERFALSDEFAGRAWRIGPRGWAGNALTWAVGLMFFGAAGALVLWQVRITRAHRRWLGGRSGPPWASGPARVATVYGALAVMLAMSGSALAFRAQIIESNRHTTMEVPALAKHGLPTTMDLADRGDNGPDGTWEIEPQHGVHVEEWAWAKSSELMLGADVTRYETADQALAAQQLFLTEAAKEGVRQRLADGTEIIVKTERGDPFEDGQPGRLSTDVVASALRGRLLVTLKVSDRPVYEYTPGVKPPVVTETPMIRDVLADNASRLEEASYPWWY
jgi:hypothetical protein